MFLTVREALEQNNRYQKMQTYIRKLYLGLFLLCLTLTAGVTGYMFIEGYSLNQAFYMTIITLSTVGFSEVRELSEAGRVFTSFLIIFNLGIFAYAISAISTFLIEGEFRKLYKEYRMIRKIDKLDKHVIVCGFGRHGQQLVSELFEEHYEFVIIEKDQEKISMDARQDKFLYLQGDATNDDLLRDAGIDRAEALVVTIRDETDNLYVVLSARRMNPDLKIITRAINPKSEEKLIHAGANHVVLPERISGFYMARLVSNPEEVEFFKLLSNMGKARITFDEVPCKYFKDKFLDKSIRQLDLRAKTGVNILGLQEEGKDYVVNPSPDTLLNKRMTLIILGNYAQLEKFRNMMIGKGNKKLS